MVDTLLVKINTSGISAQKIRKALRKRKLKFSNVRVVKSPKTKTNVEVSGNNLEDQTEEVREAIEDNVGVQINEID